VPKFLSEKITGTLTVKIWSISGEILNLNFAKKPSYNELRKTEMVPIKRGWGKLIASVFKDNELNQLKNDEI
jgi:hypothetical protein